MTRLMVVGLSLGVVLLAGTTQRAEAQASKIASSMGDLRWGMSEGEVASFAKRNIEEKFAEQIKKTKDSSKQSQLKSELKKAQSEVSKSKVEFEGSSSRWDKSPVAGEFSYGNGESMLVAKDPGSENYYFFVNGRLWKWYRAVDKGGAGDFKKFSQSVEGQFGKGRAKKGEIAIGQGETQFVEYMDRNSRLRAADNSKRGVYAMIFEEMATVRELASTRPQKPTRLAGQTDESDEAEAKAAKAKAAADESQVAKAAPKRSIFGNEQKQESEADYQSRKQKQATEARDRQERSQQRKDQLKKGEVLNKLDGLSETDPLGGI